MTASLGCLPVYWANRARSSSAGHSGVVLSLETTWNKKTA